MMNSRVAAIVSTVALAPGSFGSALAADATGLWSTAGAKAQVRISPCGGELCGSIVALARPNDPETGRPKTDKNNADPAKRNRPLIGVRVLLGLKPDGADKWAGRIYDAESGRLVSGTIALHGQRSLRLEGCALGGMICRSQTWRRLK